MTHFSFLILSLALLLKVMSYVLIGWTKISQMKKKNGKRDLLLDMLNIYLFLTNDSTKLIVNVKLIYDPDERTNKYKM